MAKEAETNATEETVQNVTRLCKGAMPMPLVWFIKFHESHENKSEVAKKYHTTPGKISDIQSNSNQKYIVEKMKWSDEELNAAAEKIRENFVRGQAEEAENPGSVSKRGLATTQPGDEAASLEVIEQIRSMKVPKDAVTLEEARAAFNAENPRKKPAKTKSDDSTEVEEAKEVSESAIEEEADSLFD